MIAMLAVQSGGLPTPRDIWMFSEEVGKVILQLTNTFSAKESANDKSDWKLHPMHRPEYRRQKVAGLSTGGSALSSR